MSMLLRSLPTDPPRRRRTPAILLLVVGLAATTIVGCGGGDALTVYSGRNKNLVEPLLDRFEDETGIDVKVRYGESAELAALITTEGDKSPADVFFAQDAGAVGAVAGEGLLSKLPDDITGRVESRFVGAAGDWVGVTGRARVVVYNTKSVAADDVPATVSDLTDTRWKDRVGWSPPNGSFQAFVSAMRLQSGDAATESWLQAMIANGARSYRNNLEIVNATASGELDAGLVNSYYLPQVIAEKGPVDAANQFLQAGDPGALVNVSAAGVMKTTQQAPAAQRLIDYLLSDAGQRYFVDETFEYPLVAGIAEPAGNPPLTDVQGTNIDLAQLGGKLPSTVQMLERAGLL